MRAHPRHGVQLVVLRTHETEHSTRIELLRAARDELLGLGHRDPLTVVRNEFGGRRSAAMTHGFGRPQRSGRDRACGDCARNHRSSRHRLTRRRGGSQQPFAELCHEIVGGGTSTLCVRPQGDRGAQCRNVVGVLQRHAWQGEAVGDGVRRLFRVGFAALIHGRNPSIALETSRNARCCSTLAFATLTSIAFAASLIEALSKNRNSKMRRERSGS